MTALTAEHDGALMYRYTDTFSIGDALLGKLKNIFSKMYYLWNQYFFRSIIERGVVAADDMPIIEEDGDGSDVADEAFEFTSADMMPGRKLRQRSQKIWFQSKSLRQKRKCRSSE